MMDSVQAAYEKAQQDKHMKRVQRLAQQGHNVDNLRRSWDGENRIGVPYCFITACRTRLNS